MEIKHRHISLKTTYNTRDAGGYVNKHGIPMRQGLLFRSDGLHKLNEESMNMLRELGLRSIIDLRTFGETNEHPNPFKNALDVQYRHYPIFDNYANGLPASLLAMYLRMYEQHATLRKIFEHLAQANSFPTLVHCVAGKDRTGIVIALLHDLCDLTDDDIAADYALTQELLHPLVQQLKIRGAKAGHDLDHYDKLLQADPVPFMQAFYQVRNTYGSTIAYLEHIGISKEQIEKIRSTLLEI
jgi:protein-tyrosine phosphatase